MKDDTTIRNMGGSWYLRISPSFARHLELNGTDLIDAMIQDEQNSKGQRYCSFWVKGK